MRRLAPLAFALAALPACGGSGTPPPVTTPGTPPSGGVLRVATEAVPSLDPAFAVRPAERRLQFALCTPLVTFPDAGDEQGKTLVPGLAQDLPAASADGRTFALALKQGVRFADGTPVTAADVRRTFERLLDPALGSPAAPVFAAIAGARAYRAGRSDHLSGIVVSGREIRFRLSRGDPSFPARLALPAACPVKASTPSRPIAPAAARGIATGPYRVARVDSRRLVLTRNPAYDDATLGRRGLVNRIDVLVGVSREDALADVRADRVDLSLDGLPRVPERQLVPRDGASPAPAVVASGDVGLLALDAGQPPFDNVRVRRAVDVGVDREAIAALAGGPLWASPSADYLTDAVPGFVAARRVPLGGDVDAARRLLQSSGVPMPVDVILGVAGPGDRPIAEAIAHELAPAGFRVHVVSGLDAAGADARLARARPRLTDAGHALSAVLGRSDAVPRSTGMSRALRAAARASGEVRTLAFDRVAPRVADRYAPVVSLWHANFPWMPSSRIDRVGSHPVMQIDLAAVGVRRS